MFILGFIPYHYFLHIVFVLLPLVLFWLYLNYFHGILPIDLVTYLILLSVLLMLFPFTVPNNRRYYWVRNNQKTQNRQNHAFLLTKSAVGTFRKRLISYRKIFLFFFSCLSKKNGLLRSHNGLYLPQFS